MSNFNGTIRTLPQYLYELGLCSYAIFSAFSIAGSQISLGLALFGLLLRWKNERFSLPLPSFLMAYGVFVLAGILSLINAQDLMRGILELKKYLILIVFLIPYWGNPSAEVRKKVFGFMLLSASVIGLYGVTQTLTKLLYSSHESFFRATGFYSMTLTFGECQALYLLVALAWHEIEAKRTIRFFLKTAIIALFGGMLASFTRGAFLGFTLGALILYRRNWYKLFAIFAILFLCIVAFGHIIRPKDDALKVESKTIQSIGHNARWEMWKHGLSFWQTAPLFGVGLNNIKPLYKAWLEQNPNYPYRELHGHLHNNFMQFLVMTGLFGLIAFVWLLAAIARFCYLQPLLNHTFPSTKFSSLALWIAFIGFGFTEYSFGDEEVAMLTFFLLGISHYSKPYPETTHTFETQ